MPTTNNSNTNQRIPAPLIAVMLFFLLYCFMEKPVTLVIFPVVLIGTSFVLGVTKRLFNLTTEATVKYALGVGFVWGILGVVFDTGPVSLAALIGFAVGSILWQRMRNDVDAIRANSSRSPQK